MKTKIILTLLLISPLSVLAESIAVPVYGTAPAVPAVKKSPIQESPPSSAQNKSAAKKSTEELKKNTSNKTNTPLVEKPLPPPSKTTMNMLSALRSGNLVMAEYHLKQGGDLNCKNCYPNKKPPLHDIYRDRNPNNDDALPAWKWMIDHGADPDAADDNGMTLMMRLTGSHSIVNESYPTSARLDFMALADQGAKATLADNNGDNALHHLASKVEVRHWGERSWVLILDKLLSMGVDINAANNDGITPLMMVADDCSPVTLRTLLARKADPSRKNNVGQSALSIAIDKASHSSEKNCNDIVSILQSPSTVAENITGAPTVSAANTSPSVVEWSGTFLATAPKRGEAKVTAMLAPSGEVSFSSTSGLHGKGRLDDRDGKVKGSVTAISPLDASGRPVFGASEIVFDLSGESINGVMRGKYKSVIESGNFVLCSPDARQNPKNDCNDASAPGALTGLLKGLKAISN